MRDVMLLLFLFVYSNSIYAQILMGEGTLPSYSRVQSIDGYRLTEEDKKKVTDCEKEYDKLRSEYKSRQNESSRILNDFRNGKFCSKCGMTPDEIKREKKQDFNEHLKAVNGKAIFSQKKYDEKKDRLYKELSDLAKKIDRHSETCNRLFNDGVNNAARIKQEEKEEEERNKKEEEKKKQLEEEEKRRLEEEKRRKEEERIKNEMAEYDRIEEEKEIALSNALQNQIGISEFHAQQREYIDEELNQNIEYSNFLQAESESFDDYQSEEINEVLEIYENLLEEDQNNRISYSEIIDRIDYLNSEIKKLTELINDIESQDFKNDLENNLTKGFIYTGSIQIIKSVSDQINNAAEYLSPGLGKYVNEAKEKAYQVIELVQSLQKNDKMDAIINTCVLSGSSDQKILCESVQAITSDKDRFLKSANLIQILAKEELDYALSNISSGTYNKNDVFILETINYAVNLGNDYDQMIKGFETISQYQDERERLLIQIEETKVTLRFERNKLKAEKEELLNKMQKMNISTKNGQ